ncbi:hypothetical protein C8T65DRAFT_816557 [Cerioporus squamosus]|nr:hypothetical protein C8T65DRAFT_816557 [Cerioporus squamosus]
MSNNPASLLDLNSDVLIHIFEALRPSRRLRPLSETCRYVRSLAMPVLFRECRVFMRKPITTAFLPETMWPYVFSLLLVDACPGRSPKESAYRTDNYAYSLRYTDDPMLCGILDASVLRRSLPAMPRLRRISLVLRLREVHGVHGDVAAAILSTPQIRDVTVSLFVFCPRRQSFPRDVVGQIPPLTSFQYIQSSFREPPMAYPAEVEAIGLVLGELHMSLEVLELPAETAPLEQMSRLDWPRLQRLTLRGEFPNMSPIPLIGVIIRMPCLRVLILSFTYVPSVDRQCLWPPGWGVVVDSLPDIEELTVTHPSPEDLLYTRLPTSIRRLSLCCSPRYALQVWVPDRYSRWSSPLPAASELLRILSSTPLLRLEHLNIEYKPDDQEEDLWRFFSSSCPQLTSMELHRMDSSSVTWPAVDIIVSVTFRPAQHSDL